MPWVCPQHAWVKSEPQAGTYCVPRFGPFDPQLVAELVLSLPPHRCAALAEWLTAHAGEVSERGTNADCEQDVAELVSLFSIPNPDEITAPIDIDE